jgi:hypothetical protein
MIAQFRAMALASELQELAASYHGRHQSDPR